MQTLRNTHRFFFKKLKLSPLPACMDLKSSVSQLLGRLLSLWEGTDRSSQPATQPIRGSQTSKITFTLTARMFCSYCLCENKPQQKAMRKITSKQSPSLANTAQMFTDAYRPFTCTALRLRTNSSQIAPRINRVDKATTWN